MMNRLRLMMKIGLILMGVIFLAEAQDYNIVDRFQILEDKFRTQEMLREFDHSFILDIVALANTDVTDFIDEAGDVADFQGTNEQKLAEAQRFLRKYDKTEQNLRIGVGFNIPIFSLSAWGIKIKPSSRAGVNLGFLMGIQTSNLTPSHAI